MKKLLLFLMLLLPLMVVAQEAGVNNDSVYLVVESMPEFQGGQAAMFNYIRKKLQYPKEAEENHFQGRVLCQFVIAEDGKVTDVEVINSSGFFSLDAEAVRVIQSMPQWVPGQNGGKPVKVRYVLPIKFGRPSQPSPFTGIWELKRRVISGDFQVDSDKQITWVENIDYCSYTSMEGNSIIHPGRYDNTLRHQEVRNAGKKFLGTDILVVKYGTWCRGVPIEAKKIKNQYCCPIKAGAETKIRYYDGDKQHVRFSIAVEDTIYAMRGGVVCLSGHPSGVVVYHKDGSFGVYRCFSEVYVAAGDQIHAGQALGLSMSEQLSVYFLYLDKRKIFDAKSPGDAYTFFYPSIMTDTGLRQSNLDTTIVVPPVSDEIIMLDMNKVQQKKYQKEHNK